jgi:plastocyanin
MKRHPRLTALGSLRLAALRALSLGVLNRTFAASLKASPGATAPEFYTVTTGWGNYDFAANVYTPNRVQIYVGDTITWHNNSLREPHTITFGSVRLLTKLGTDLTVPVPPTPTLA